MCEPRVVCCVHEDSGHFFPSRYNFAWLLPYLALIRLPPLIDKTNVSLTKSASPFLLPHSWIGKFSFNYWCACVSWLFFLLCIYSHETLQHSSPQLWFYPLSELCVCLCVTITVNQYKNHISGKFRGESLTDLNLACWFVERVFLLSHFINLEFGTRTKIRPVWSRPCTCLYLRESRVHNW